MSFGSNDISSIINDNDNSNQNNNQYLDNNNNNNDINDNDNNDDIVNKILEELEDENYLDNENNLDDNNYNTDNFKNIQEFDNVSPNYNNKININHNNFDYDNSNNLLTNRLNDDINLKNSKINNEYNIKPTNKTKIEEEEQNNNFNWCSSINIFDILRFINKYKTVILIFFISLIVNNTIVNKQLSTLSFFTTSDSKLNFIAYIFQSILLCIIYIIINYLIKFI